MLAARPLVQAFLDSSLEDWYALADAGAGGAGSGAGARQPEVLRFEARLRRSTGLLGKVGLASDRSTLTLRAPSEAELAAWLVRSRDWSTALHHLEILTRERARELLRGGADVNGAGPSTPVDLAKHLCSIGAAAAGSPTG